MDQFDVTHPNDDWMFSEQPEVDKEIEEEEE